MSTVQGEGIVLATALFGEKNRLLTVFSREHGRVKGVLRGLKNPPCQPLDGLAFQHFRRLDSQLGTFEAEPQQSRAGWWLAGRAGVLTVAWLCELLLAVLPEEHAYPGLYAKIGEFLDEGPGDGVLWQKVVVLELLVLRAVGYGVALVNDPVGGDDGSGFVYVSPKSGRAVSAEAGKDFADKLLVLPAFLDGPAQGETEDRAASLTLSGFFIRQAVAAIGGKAQPLAARRRLVTWLNEQSGQPAD